MKDITINQIQNVGNLILIRNLRVNKESADRHTTLQNGDKQQQKISGTLTLILSSEMK